MSRAAKSRAVGAELAPPPPAASSFVGAELARPPWTPTFGAIPERDGTRFSVWASGARSVTLQVETPGGAVIERLPLARTAEALFEARVATGDKTRYRYTIDDRGPYPDPASRFQPDGVHGASQVVDWGRYAWSDGGWSGVRFEDLVIYELHVGTFTPASSFLGVVERLPHLVDLGVTAIELMPVAAFPGRRNWGYDGAALFAPAAQYGTPADLQRLVDAAHRAGLAVLIDVVYNHLGPDGAYLAAFSPDFFTPHHKSPWGEGVNLDGPGSAVVRQFLIENALHWVHEYHVDGLRLDATHALADDSPRHFLGELADTLHALDVGRPLHVVAEDARNLAAIVRPASSGGWGLDGVWADDFHHEVHSALTGENEGYYVDYGGSAGDIATTIERGWFYAGQRSRYTGKAKGSDTTGIDLARFIFCLQNHDQIGNRAFGDRLGEIADLAACRAAAALLLLAPETPLLFMGEEWSASTPFRYFTDHNAELGRLVTEGRRREFEKFPAFSDPETRTRIPDPQDEATFEASRLKWDEISQEPHASMLRLYRALTGLRRSHAEARRDASAGERRRASALDDATICVAHDDLLVAARLKGAGRVTIDSRAAGRGGRDARLQPRGVWRVALTTEDAAFAPDARPPRVEIGPASVEIHFARPGAVVLRSTGDRP